MSDLSAKAKSAEIEESWEYYIPDPEILEAVSTNLHGRIFKNSAFEWSDNGSGKQSLFSGYRIGDPNHDNTYVAKDQTSETDDEREAKRKKRKKYRLKMTKCRRCNKPLVPGSQQRLYCSKACGVYQGRRKKPSDNRMKNFQIAYERGDSLKQMAQQFGVQKACLQKWRKALGLKPRPSGNLSRKQQ